MNLPQGLLKRFIAPTLYIVNYPQRPLLYLLKFYISYKHFFRDGWYGFV